MLFRNATNGGRCGMAQSAMGPFYCPPDKQIFLDTSFFREVETKFRGCSGNACKFTTAYIIAHEAGHHIQNLLGILPRVTRLQQQAGSKAEANALQVKVELQADCLSGVWVNREEKKRPGFVEPGDIEAALTTATAIGDDTLQRQATGRVVPDSFTHGSAAQRKQWFMTGYQQGTVQACNTFGRVCNCSSRHPGCCAARWRCAAKDAAPVAHPVVGPGSADAALHALHASGT